jgi:phosphohistidine phosphatase SixA
MAELYLIRHAQASFGADNYDQLSDLDHQQSQSLGKALADQGVSPDLFYAGDMQRHRETLEGIQAGLGQKKKPLYSSYWSE